MTPNYYWACYFLGIISAIVCYGLLQIYDCWQIHRAIKFEERVLRLIRREKEKDLP